jgi:hypothetical protein
LAACSSSQKLCALRLNLLRPDSINQLFVIRPSLERESRLAGWRSMPVCRWPRFRHMFTSPDCDSSCESGHMRWRYTVAQRPTLLTCLAHSVLVRWGNPSALENQDSNALDVTCAPPCLGQGYWLESPDPRPAAREDLPVLTWTQRWEGPAPVDHPTARLRDQDQAAMACACVYPTTVPQGHPADNRAD